jgi:hypothetical protein
MQNIQNKRLIQFLGSLILLPIATASMSFGEFPEYDTDIVSSQIVSLQQENIEKLGSILPFGFSVDEEAMLESQIREAKAVAIDAYFSEYKMPLAGTGMKMVEEAEKNDIDWRLLPAIAVIESTGGKFACKGTTHSFFGWGSCKIPFKSKDHAIEVVAWNLGGNNPNTARYYADKTTKQILQKYNPPRIVPLYAQKVMRVMENIGEKEVTPARLLSSNI